jgi:hypothetical protein
MDGEIKMDMRKPYLHCIPLNMAYEGTTYLALLPSGIYRTVHKDKNGVWQYTNAFIVKSITMPPVPTHIWLPTSLIPLEDDNAED